LPDDEDLAAGRYGINFHRAKPDYETARSFYKELNKVAVNQEALNSLAFAAANREEYDKKSAAWDKFYSFIWDEKPQNLWVTPHSGGIHRKPDRTFPYPKLEMDAGVAGVAARCAIKDDSPAIKRTMMSIHSLNWYSALVDMGSFGINDEKKLKAIAARVDDKFGDRAQVAAEGCRRDFAARLMPWLEHILRIKGTLDLNELAPRLGTEWCVVLFASLGLKLYGREIKLFTLDEFKEKIESLKDERIRVASCNHIYSGEQIGKQLALKEQMHLGRMGAAVQLECMKFYLKKMPELMAEIILDIKRALLEQV
jgi:hypothetical protein